MRARLLPSVEPVALSRRRVLQFGALGTLGSSLAEPSQASSSSTPKSVLFIFVNGGISQHDSFDLKPEAPSDIRGEFQPIDTATPGIQVCEHLPEFAKRSNDYALVRSIATDSSGHEEACHMLFTGRLDLPPGFSLDRVPNPNEWPSIAAQITYALRDRGGLPPAAVLPQPSVNEAARFRPGQYAGRLGSRWEAWHLDIAAPCPLGNGACPNCFRFDADHFEHAAQSVFDVPLLSLPDGGESRLSARVDLLAEAEQSRRFVEQTQLHAVDRNRRQALSILADERTRRAFEVERADPAIVDRYGRNKFGLSLLMASRLLESGVKFVQVNLGKNSSWDTHARNFVNLKRNLLPYFDQSVSALLDDLRESGRLDDTLVVITGEFGRTPKINKDAGRDHWGPVMTSVFAGGGVRGGQVIGRTDALGAYPTEDMVTVEHVAATVFAALGIPRDQEWHDVDGRPHAMYRGEPIGRLYA
ncbi:MAG: DUF1501 domain-containing protein [Planctomycetaceae bacterium]|nr:DUF1501 domain-containing protein [Planctomycetaceae bacterium]